MAEMHHERMSPDYEPPLPPPAYENKVNDADDIVLHSKRGCFTYVNDANVAAAGCGQTPNVNKTDV